MIETTDLDVDAARLANLTFDLLANCHEKELRVAKAFQLTPAEFRCLRLFDVNEKASNKSLAQRMNLSAGRLSRIIDGLTRKGYLIRREDPIDRRNMEVSLSKKGAAFVNRLNDDYTAIHREILESIDEAKHDDLIDGMTHLLSAVKDWIAKGTESPD